jgi:ATP-dependent Lon protease
LEFTRIAPVMKVRARVIDEPEKADKKIRALMRSALNLFDRVVELNRSIPEEAHLFAMNISEPGWLADMLATALSLDFEERQALLLMRDPQARLERLNELLAAEVDVLELEDEIHTRVQSEVDKSQREFYLREQMKAIQTELGEGDIWTRDVTELRQKVDEAKLPEEAKKVALKELERLNQMPPMAPEVGIIRTYIEWILDLPWSIHTDDNLDVSNAAKVLDRDHYGLQKAKDRILEFIAVRSLKPKKGTPADFMLCRASRHRQNIAGAFDCRGAGTQVCARFAGRRARRGRNSRPPPYLYRRTAGAHHPDHEARGQRKPALYAG